MTCCVVTGAAMTVGLGGCITALGRHFKTHLPLVTSLTLTGSAVAGFVLPPLIQILLEKYSLHGALLILSGFTLNLVVTGTLLGMSQRVKMPARREIVEKPPDLQVFTVLQGCGNPSKSSSSSLNFDDLKSTNRTSRR